jgi:hypothetical protein
MVLQSELPSGAVGPEYQSKPIHRDTMRQPVNHGYLSYVNGDNFVDTLDHENGQEHPGKRGQRRKMTSNDFSWNGMRPL